METRGRKRLRSEDDVGTGGTGGAGPPRGAFVAARGASAAAGDDEMIPENLVETDPARFDYMHNKIQIRSKHGAPETARWSRRNLLLFLRGLPNTNERLDRNRAYTEATLQALREADEPEGIMNLTRLGAKTGFERVLGNAEAGRLFEAIYARSCINTAAGRNHSTQMNQVRSRLPIVPFETQTILGQNFMGLFPDGGPDWVWTLLRSACYSGLDVRYRSLREGGQIDDEGNPGFNVVPPSEFPAFVGYRAEQVNAMIHGGDLRLDALICQLEFANTRYGPMGFTDFYETLFKHVYGMSSEVALWLCKSIALIAPISSWAIQRYGSRAPPD